MGCGHERIASESYLSGDTLIYGPGRSNTSTSSIIASVRSLSDNLGTDKTNGTSSLTSQLPSAQTPFNCKPGEDYTTRTHDHPALGSDTEPQSVRTRVSEGTASTMQVPAVNLIDC